MKPAFLLAAALLATPADARDERSPAGAAIVARDAELNALIVGHDVAAAGAYYDEAFVLTTSSGKVKTKADLLAEIALPGLVLEVNETADAVVRVRADTAVLTGILHQRGSLHGKAFDVRLRVTDTWVRQRGTWRILAGHASVVP
jgi:ketosteroid isomerase-like protein